MSAALLILTTWRMQILVAFDTTAARAMGINVAAYELIANIAVGLIVLRYSPRELLTERARVVREVRQALEAAQQRGRLRGDDLQ